MKRINVNFSDEVFESLTRRAKKNGSSIAFETRELVELGLKIEAAAEQHSEQPADNHSEKLIGLMKQNLIWVLEARLLARHLAEHLLEDDQNDQLKTLEKYKEKAKHYVEGMFLT